MVDKRKIKLCRSRKPGPIICFIIALIAVTLADTGCVTGHGPFGKKAEITDVFDQTVALVEKNYIDKKGNTVILDTSMQPDVSTIVAQLDSTTVLLSSEEVQTLVNPSGGAVGVYIGLKEESFEIQGTYPDSPARKAGLHRSDKIIEINDAPVSGLLITRVIRLLQGAPDSEVTLKIKTRSGDEKLIRLSRKVLKVPVTVAERFVEGGVGYLRIERFWPDTSTEVRAAMKRLLKNNMTGLVIDLRNNSGGLLTSITEVAQLFIKNGKVIVTLTGSHDNQGKVFKTTKWFPFTDCPIVVLIDGQTSSGAEILAAALRDNKRALLVGESSAGLCDIQTVYPLKDGSQLRIRTALSYTPGGEPIDGHGVKPDRRVDLTKEEHDRLYDSMEAFPELNHTDISEDVQLKAAIMILSENSESP